MKHLNNIAWILVLSLGVSACTLTGAPPAPPLSTSAETEIGLPANPHLSSWLDGTRASYLGEVESTPDSSLQFKAQFYEGTKLSKAELDYLKKEAFKTFEGVEFIYPMNKEEGEFQIEADRALVWVNPDGSRQIRQLYLPLNTWLWAEFTPEGADFSYAQRFVLTKQGDSIIMLEPMPAE